MKTFQQFQEQLKDKFTNTTDAAKNVLTGKGVGDIQQKLKSGEISIKDMKNLSQSDELKGGIENIVQGFGKDASMNVTKFLKKLDNFKLPTK